MRVLVVTTWYPTAASPSTGVFVARDVAAIATRHEVRVLHLCAPALLGAEDRRPDTDAAVPVERMAMDPRRPDHVARARRRVRELARGADVLHTMAVSALLPMTGRRPGVPWVHTEHWSGLLAPETLPAPLRAVRPGVMRLLRRPDVVAVVSEHLAAGVRAVRRGPVVVVANIVDISGEPPARRLPDIGLAERGPLRVAGVGGLIERKDPAAAVEAVAELRDRGIDARLTWVGDGPLREATVARAEARRVPLSLTGPVPPDQVNGLVGESDVFLLPTRAETFCVAAAEALALGRPVVVGDSGGPRDFVHPPSGILVPPGAPARAWADAVEQVWSQTGSVSATDIAAPVRERFSPESYAQRVDAIYRSLTGHPRDTGSTYGPKSQVVGHAGPSDPLARGSEPSDPVVRGSEPSDPLVRGVQPLSRGSGEPLVDVVVATHSPRRQIERAVRSVLDGSGNLDVRVTVVCHDLPAEEIEVSLTPETRSDLRLRLLEHRDGVPSPAGPFTAGLDAATAPWVSIMGSDDRLSPGALEHWLDVAARTGAEVVLAEIQLDGGRVATPPTRVRPGRHPRREAQLDLVRDRLSYRSAPLGLLSRAAVERTGARLLPGAQTGEDVPFVTRLYAGARVARAEGTPYLIGTDAGDRATAVPRPVRDELVAVTALLDDPWFTSLPLATRRAVATKLLRIHVFSTVGNRPDPAWWTDEERDDLADIARRLVTEVPGSAEPLGLADHDLLAAICDPGSPTPRLLDLAQARRRHGTPRTLLPHSWRHVFHREAPLRFMAASLAARR